MRPDTARFDFSGGEAPDLWRRAFENDPAQHPFATIGPETGFSGRYAARDVGEALVADVRAQPLLLRDQAAPPGATLVVLQAVVEGRPVFQNAESDAHILRPGQVIIRRRNPAAVIRSDRFARVTTIILPQYVLVPRYATAEGLSACGPVADEALPSRLLYELIAGLGDDEDLVEQRRAGFVDVLGGLVALLLARMPEPPAALSDLAALRAADMLSYMRRNFSNSQLDPQTMADDLSISVRYVHKLMRLTGRSFREALTELRLQSARLAFADNRRPRRTIAEIAISVGFNDLSQFNRHFRAAFGMTPRAARRLDEAHGYAAPGGLTDSGVDGRSNLPELLGRNGAGTAFV